MKYTQIERYVIIDKILDRICKGESLRSVLRDKDYPSRATFFRWMDEDELTQNRYARACEYRADEIFDEIFDIADRADNDFQVLPDGREVVNHEHIQRAKLMIDSRKWALGKMMPKKYGDKVDVTSNGETVSQSPFLDLMKAVGAEKENDKDDK